MRGIRTMKTFLLLNNKKFRIDIYFCLNYDNLFKILRINIVLHNAQILIIIFIH